MDAEAYRGPRTGTRRGHPCRPASRVPRTAGGSRVRRPGSRRWSRRSRNPILPPSPRPPGRLGGADEELMGHAGDIPALPLSVGEHLIEDLGLTGGNRNSVPVDRIGVPDGITDGQEAGWVPVHPIEVSPHRTRVPEPGGPVDNLGSSDQRLPVRRRQRTSERPPWVWVERWMISRSAAQPGQPHPALDASDVAPAGRRGARRIREHEDSTAGRGLRICRSEERARIRNVTVGDRCIGCLDAAIGEPPERTPRSASGIDDDVGGYLFAVVERYAAHGNVPGERAPDGGAAAHVHVFQALDAPKDAAGVRGRSAAAPSDTGFRHIRSSGPVTTPWRRRWDLNPR